MQGFIETMKDGASTIALLAHLTFGQTPPPTPIDHAHLKIGFMEEKTQKSELKNNRDSLRDLDREAIPIVHLPTQAELDQAKAKALKGNPVDIRNYQYLQLRRYEPSLFKDDKATFIISLTGEKNGRARFSDAFAAAASPQQAQDEHKKGEDIWRTFTNTLGDTSPFIEKGISYAYKDNFAGIILNGQHCDECRIPPKVPYSPDLSGLHKGSQIDQAFGQFFAVDHEVGHMLAARHGLKQKWYPAGADSKLIEYGQNQDETFCDTYASLKMLALFRSDALPYLHYLAISRQASSDITHMSQSGVANVIRWAQQHPQELGTLTPDRSFALAQQLYQPLRPLTFEALEGDRHSGKDRISRRFMSLAGEALGKIDLLKPLAESIYPAELAAIDYNDPSVQIDALAKMAKQIGSSELNSETQDVLHTLKPPPDKKPNITP